VVIALGVASRLEGEVSVAARRPALDLAGSVPFVRDWIDLDGPLGPLLVGAVRGKLPEKLASFARIVVLRADPDGEAARSLGSLAPWVVTVASARPGAEGSAHRRVAAVLSLDPDPPTSPWVTPVLPVPRGRAIVVHPGSGGRTKCWPASCFAEVSRLLTEGGVGPMVWVLGPAEIEAGMHAPSGVEVLAAPPLARFVEHLAGASAYLGCDSGPSHLAAAVGTPCVLLFGPTNPSIWAPAAGWVRVIQGQADHPDGHWGAAPRAVARAIEGLPARPCKAARSVDG